jgi:hypothetical protein
MAADDHGPAAGRPKYGALNFRQRVVGGPPRFGSQEMRPGNAERACRE